MDTNGHTHTHNNAYWHSDGYSHRHANCNGDSYIAPNKHPIPFPDSHADADQYTNRQ